MFSFSLNFWVILSSTKYLNASWVCYLQKQVCLNTDTENTLEKFSKNVGYIRYHGGKGVAIFCSQLLFPNSRLFVCTHLFFLRKNAQPRRHDLAKSTHFLKEEGPTKKLFFGISCILSVATDTGLCSRYETFSFVVHEKIPIQSSGFIQNNWNRRNSIHSNRYLLGLFEI